MSNGLKARLVGCPHIFYLEDIVNNSYLANMRQDMTYLEPKQWQRCLVFLAERTRLANLYIYTWVSTSPIPPVSLKFSL
jgi:hypothetical protein